MLYYFITLLLYSYFIILLCLTPDNFTCKRRVLPLNGLIKKVYGETMGKPITVYLKDVVSAQFLSG